MKNKGLDDFLKDQLSCWPLACNNFRALRNAEVKEFTINGLDVRAQFNPCRISSSTAKTDEDSLKSRKCFLCRDNRPKEQKRLRFEGRKGKKYDILANPYPIFHKHFVIASDRHSEQSIWKRYVDILDLSRTYQDYIFFYNGPKCGASAPDHLHFQATERGQMPLEIEIDRQLDSIEADLRREGNDSIEYVTSVQDAELFHYKRFTKGIFALSSKTAKSAAKLLYRLLDCAEIVPGDSEPRFNLFSYYKNGEYRSFVILRTTHRSHHYFSQGPDHMTMSPGCVDMAGLIIVPVEEDFRKADAALLSEILAEVSVSEETERHVIKRLTREQPLVSVGIMSGKEIAFEILSDGAGARTAKYKEGKIEYDGALYDELFFEAPTLSTMFAAESFVLHDVVIGKGFHWERKENQVFAGALIIIVENNGLTAVNVIGIEDYLVSVISSEMKSTASEEFLKAHSVISRSWVMSRLCRRSESAVPPCVEAIDNLPSLVSYADSVRNAAASSALERIVWYDHQEHRHYDVCADDHCQRYQGLTKLIGDRAKTAVDATWGQVLMYDGQLCDTRFSKCCGGTMELFSSCWEDKDYPYLQALPDEYCNTSDKDALAQVLNDYDLETTDFYRWKVIYDADVLSELISRRLGCDLGDVIALEPLQRGPSGRIVRLRIYGTKQTMTIGKELEIRRVLSESHLKSSAFDIEYLDGAGKPVDAEIVLESARKAVLESARAEEHASARDKTPDSERDKTLDSDLDKVPGRLYSSVVLHGSGWGHGVGLCQIGAAVMASRGHSYEEILAHYYPGANKQELAKLE